MALTEAKMRPMSAAVGGVIKTIFILATDSPDGLIGVIFRGEWDPNAIYNFQNEVIVSAGDNAGLYGYNSATPSTGAAGANPTQPPWYGAPQWVQKGTFGGNGNWG